MSSAVSPPGSPSSSSSSSSSCYSASATSLCINLPASFPPELAAKVNALLAETDPEKLPVRERPQLPVYTPTTGTRQRLRDIQRFISAFEYNLTGTQYFLLRKDRGLRKIQITAKEIIKEALPIRCIEAVFMGCFLTVDVLDAVRFPMAFKSEVNGHTFQHIVMAVQVMPTGKWGAIGLSRRKELGGKDFTFKSLSDLVRSYRESYAACSHELLAVYVGFEFGRNMLSQDAIYWRVLKADLQAHPSWEVHAGRLDRFAASAGDIFHTVAREGRLRVSLMAKYGLGPIEEAGDGAGESDGKGLGVVQQRAGTACTPTRRRGRSGGSSGGSGSGAGGAGGAGGGGGGGGGATLDAVAIRPLTSSPPIGSPAASPSSSASLLHPSSPKFVHGSPKAAVPTVNRRTMRPLRRSRSRSRSGDLLLTAGASTTTTTTSTASTGSRRPPQGMTNTSSSGSARGARSGNSGSSKTGPRSASMGPQRRRKAAAASGGGGGGSSTRRDDDEATTDKYPRRRLSSSARGKSRGRSAGSRSRSSSRSKKSSAAAEDASDIGIGVAGSLENGPIEGKRSDSGHGDGNNTATLSSSGEEVTREMTPDSLDDDDGNNNDGDEALLGVLTGRIDLATTTSRSAAADASSSSSSASSASCLSEQARVAATQAAVMKHHPAIRSGAVPPISPVRVPLAGKAVQGKAKSVRQVRAVRAAPGPWQPRQAFLAA